MAGVNKVIIVGNLGADPEVRTTPQGQMVATFSLATSENFTGKDGHRQEKTEWHRIVVWGKLAEIVQRFLTKGRQVYVEGKLQTRSWDDKQSGQKRYVTEVQAERVQGLDRAEGGHHEQQRLDEAPRGRPAQRPAAPAGQADDGGFFDEDVPF